jgi:hypothetical protein
MGTGRPHPDRPPSGDRASAVMHQDESVGSSRRIVVTAVSMAPLSRGTASVPGRHAGSTHARVAARSTMGGMPKVPESTKSSLDYKLSARARERWPRLTSIEITHGAGIAYVTGTVTDGQQLPLCRLRYGGSASIWGFSIYSASHDDYQPSMLPSGATAGSPEDALDSACGLYLGDPTAWIRPPKD